jgi:hypothetical protein
MDGLTPPVLVGDDWLRYPGYGYRNRMTTSPKPDRPDDDQPAPTPGTDPRKTDHPTGEDQAKENAENEPAG